MPPKDTSPASDLYLGIDMGGHASRAIVFDANGEIVAKALTEIATHHPAPDRVEHDPQEMLDAVNRSLAAIAEQLGDRCEDVLCAGLATQRSTIVCWDRTNGEALSPVISWQDRRMTDWMEQLSASEDDIQAQTGLRLSPHYGASKLRWCMDHLPAVQEALQAGRLCWGPLASFLLFQLLEEQALLVDPANASRTLLWDLRTRDWASELMDLFGLPAAPLPRCVPSRYAYGHLRLGACRIPVELTTGDQSAALFAYGTPEPDTLYVNVGTGAFVQRPIGSRAPDAGRMLCSVVYQEGDDAQYVLEGTVNGAGSALNWVQRQLGVSPEQVQAGLGRWLEQSTNPPLFLNGVSGLGSPYWKPDFTSRFVGEGTAEDQVVAVVESIVFLLQVNVEQLNVNALPDPQNIVISGGLSNEAGLCQRLADLTGLPVYHPSVLEATARGLAYLLAGCPSEWTTGQDGGCFRPNANPALHERYGRWRRALEAELEGDLKPET